MRFRDVNLKSHKEVIKHGLKNKCAFLASKNPNYHDTEAIEEILERRLVVECVYEPNTYIRDGCGSASWPPNSIGI